MAAEISAALVKELRERTGLGMMECKKALQEANGDIELAIENLRKNAGLKSAKKAGRIAAEGIIVTQVDDKGTLGAMLEVNSETDFVARDTNFRQFADQVIQQAFTNKSENIEELMADELEIARQELVQKIGENISVRRVAIVEAPSNGIVGAYVHGNRIGVMVVMRGANIEVARNIAMHVAALNPAVALAEHMSAAMLEKEKAIILAQPDLASKPPEIAEKMVQGRLKKFIAENTLVEQAFVKEPNISVGEYARQAKGEVLAFVRFEVGEGIEKEKVDFVKEVMAQAQRH